MGKASLTLTYDGELNNKMCGFYRAKAMLDGKEEYMAVTQVCTRAETEIATETEISTETDIDIYTVSLSHTHIHSNAHTEHTQTLTK